MDGLLVNVELRTVCVLAGLIEKLMLLRTESVSDDDLDAVFVSDLGAENDLVMLRESLRLLREEGDGLLLVSEYDSEADCCIESESVGVFTFFASPTSLHCAKNRMARATATK